MDVTWMDSRVGGEAMAPRLDQELGIQEFEILLLTCRRVKGQCRLPHNRRLGPVLDPTLTQV